MASRLNITTMIRKPEPDPDKDGAYLPNRRRPKAGLNRGILGACWGLLATRTEQKAAASGRGGHVRQPSVLLAAMPQVRPHRPGEPREPGGVPVRRLRT
jgi:hypothetical protein